MIDRRRRLQAILRNVPGVGSAVRIARRVLSRSAKLVPDGVFPDLTPEQVVRTAYNVLLRREPDRDVLDRDIEALATHRLNAWDIVDRLRASDEYRCRTPIGAPSLLQSLHLSRCEFVIGLPPARSIVDLGGSHTHNPWGALVLTGYPYEFDDLVVVDLPPEDRHDLYRSDPWRAVQTPKGPVRYEFRSMTDLSFAEDASVDLVYSGQSIEHVTIDDARLVMSEVFRVLRPGGVFALDTPNAVVCRLQSADFIDPDHKIEYTEDALRTLITDAGFDIDRTCGLNLTSTSVARGNFEAGEAAANWGVFADASSCYLLAIVARRPASTARIEA